LGTGAADVQIAAGQTPQALIDARAFADAVQAQTGSSLIYVTGHSLGGTEAEAMCQVLGSSCAGGATFGATGLPGNTQAGPSSLTNYIEYGDPVGNYASDSSSALSSISPSNMSHYGSIVMVGSPAAAQPLLAGASELQSSSSASGGGPYYGGDASSALNLASLIPIANNLGFHLLATYAVDTGISTLAPSSAPANTYYDTSEQAIFMQNFGFPFGAGGTQNTEKATLSSGGVLDSPNVDIGYNASTNQVTIDVLAPLTTTGGAKLAAGIATIAGDAANDTAVTLAGPNTSAATVTLSGNTFTVATTGDEATLTANASAAVSGNNNTVNASTGCTLSVAGSTNSINAGANDAVTISGTGTTFDAVYATGDVGTAASGQGAGIVLAANTAMNLTGSGNSVTLSGSNDTAGVYGGGNSITEHAGDWLQIGSTGKTFDGVSVSGDSGAGTTSEGDPYGVGIGANCAVNVTGSSDKVILQGSNDTVGVYGGGNSITEQAGDWLQIGSTGVIFDAVYVSGDSGAGTTSEGNGYGMGLGANCAANVFGSSDKVVLQGSNDTAGIYGGGNLVLAGANDCVVLGSTGSNFDTVNASNVVGGETTSTGNGTGIHLNANTDANVNGAYDAITDTTGGKLDLTGQADVVSSGIDDVITVTGANDKVVGSSDRDEVTNNTTLTVDGSGNTIVALGKNDVVVDNLNSGGSEVFDWSSTGSETITDYTGYGGTGSVDGGSGGYYGYYGVSGAQGKAAINSGTNIGAIAAYDQQSGDLSAADAAQIGYNKAYDAANSSTTAPGLAAAVVSGQKWSGKVITWSLADIAGPAGAPFSGYMSGAYLAQVQAAFNAWAANMPGVTFVQVADSSQSDIRIGWGDFGTATTGTVGYTSYHAQAGQISAGAVIRLEDPTQDGFTAGTQTYTGTQATLYQSMLHEIGHALGLGDSSDSNSVMYYDLTTSNATLDSTDVAGIQQIYGTKSASVTPSAGLAIRPVSASAGLNKLIESMAAFDVQLGMHAAAWGDHAASVMSYHLAAASHAVHVGVQAHGRAR
jgi:hypothetical protein